MTSEGINPQCTWEIILMLLLTGSLIFFPVTGQYCKEPVVLGITAGVFSFSAIFIRSFRIFFKQQSDLQKITILLTLTAMGLLSFAASLRPREFVFGYFIFMKIVIFLASLGNIVFFRRNIIITFLLLMVLILYNPFFAIWLGNNKRWIQFNVLSITLFVLQFSYIYFTWWKKQPKKDATFSSKIFHYAKVNNVVFILLFSVSLIEICIVLLYPVLFATAAENDPAIMRLTVTQKNKNHDIITKDKVLPTDMPRKRIRGVFFGKYQNPQDALDAYEEAKQAASGQDDPVVEFQRAALIKTLTEYMLEDPQKADYCYENLGILFETYYGRKTLDERSAEFDQIYRDIQKRVTATNADTQSGKRNSGAVQRKRHKVNKKRVDLYINITKFTLIGAFILFHIVAFIAFLYLLVAAKLWGGLAIWICRTFCWQTFYIIMGQHEDMIESCWFIPYIINGATYIIMIILMRRFFKKNGMTPKWLSYISIQKSEKI